MRTDMAGRSTAQRRVNYRTGADVRYYGGRTAVYGRRGAGARAGKTAARRASGKAAVAKNRSRATSVGRGYVVFLALISLATVFMCVYYLRLKATITAQMGVNERLESKLYTMRSENDALYENVNNEVDWNYIKDVAINELGMKYATEDQIVWYNTDDSSYIRQYVDVPSA